MGYAIMLKPTDEKFICQETCEHTDCAYHRDFIEKAKCKRCFESIKPEESYYGTKLEELEHAFCAWDKVQKFICDECERIHHKEDESPIHHDKCKWCEFPSEDFRIEW